jgi:hypothetical protein
MDQVIGKLSGKTIGQAKKGTLAQETDKDKSLFMECSDRSSNLFSQP